MDVDLDRDPVEMLATEFLDRQRSGELPSINEYVERFPDLADEIRELFPTIAAMEQCKVDSAPSSGAQKRWASLDVEWLGDYRILREIGRGGMGIVYEAEQASLGRRVAVKVLPRQSLLEEKHLLRFKREAKMAARLHHTNIVPVFGVGEQDDLHFYVMQLIPGISLDRIIAELSGGREAGDTPNGAAGFTAKVAAHVLLSGQFSQLNRLPDSGSSITAEHLPTQQATRSFTGTPPPVSSAKSTRIETVMQAATDDTMSDQGVAVADVDGPIPDRRDRRYWRNVAWLGIQIADALHHAHLQGTVHRDVKPGNLLLDRKGVAWLTDFGLARHWDQESVTRTGDVAGTLLYLAPEQLEGKPTTKSDVYSLGATLYELLALRPAFTETSHALLIQQILKGGFPRPTSVRSDVPRDLETIVLKAMTRDPSRRYATAEALRDDLERFLEDRPILARRTSKTEQLWRWCRRNRTVASLAASTLLSVTLVAILAIILYIGADRSRRRLEKSLVAEEAALEAKDAALKKVSSSVAAKDAALESETTQRMRAERIARLSQEAIGKMFDRFALDRIRPVAEVTLEGDDGESVDVPTPPVLAKEDAALLDELLEYHVQLAKEAGDDENLQQRVAQAYRRIGDIRQRLGEYEDAEKAYQQALTRLAELAKTTEDERSMQFEIARIQNQLGNVLGARRKHLDQRTAYKTALGILEPMVRDGKAKREIRYELANSHYLLARRSSAGFMMMPRRGRPPERGGRDGFSRENERGRREGAQPDKGKRPERPRRPRPEDPGRSRPGDPWRNPFEEIEKHRAEAIRILEQLISEPSPLPDYRFLLALCYRDGSPWRGKDWNPASFAKDSAKAVALLNQLVKDYSSVPEYRHELIRTYAFKPAQFETDEQQAARLKKALEISDKLVLEHPNVPDYSRSHVHVLSILAFVSKKSGMKEDLASAERYYRRALKMQQSLIRRFPRAEHYRIWHSMLQEWYVHLLNDQKRYAEAVPLLKTSIQQREKQADKDRRGRYFPSRLDRSYELLADMLKAQGDEAGAADALKKAKQYSSRGSRNSGRRNGSDR